MSDADKIVRHLSRLLEGLGYGLVYGRIPLWIWRKWQSQDEQYARMEQELRKHTGLTR